MRGVVNSIITAIRLYLLRRRQFDNLKLRALFSNEYDIDVGLYSYGCFDRWRMPGPMRVGRYCSIASTVRSALNNHPLEALTTHPVLYEKAFNVVDADHKWDGFLEIEDDVWIGNNAIILSGCKRIGRGAVIGAGAVVTKNVDRYAIVAGNPARKLRDRFPSELANAIEASRWWELDLVALRNLLNERPELVKHPTVELVNSWVASRPDFKSTP